MLARRRGRGQDRERRHPGDHPRRAAGAAGHGRARASARAGHDHRARRLLLGRLLRSSPRRSSAAARCGSRASGSTRGGSGCSGSSTRMGAALEVVETAAAGREPVATIVARSGPLQATRVGARRGAAGDRRAAAGRARGLLRRRRDGRLRREELRHKESDRIATVVDGLRGLGAEIEATERRLRRSAAAAGCAAGRSTPPATTAWRCSARSPGSPRGRGSRCAASRRPGVSYPGFEPDLAGAAAGG